MVLIVEPQEIIWTLLWLQTLSYGSK